MAENKIIVVGAGMAGLLAAAMLRTQCHEVCEQQPKIPNNHSALLRFRSCVVGDTLGIEFKKVKVLKAAMADVNPIADALSYSRKSNGVYTLRSSLSAKAEIEDRYIAPTDLIEQMADRVQAPIKLNTTFKWSTGPVISTMPMPTLMDVLEWKDKTEFKYVNGCNINCELKDVNAYCTLYIPGYNIPYSRVSITGSKLTIEFSNTKDIEKFERDKNEIVYGALALIGIDQREGARAVVDSIEVKAQRFAKILPIDDDVRKRFIIWASKEHNVYSLGRFATWRPGLLLDDVVHDVRVIQRLIFKGHSYDHQK